MAESSPKKRMIGIGIFLVVGPILASILRLSGLRPPRSNSGFSQGGEMGYWIGTVIGIVIGIVVIVHGMRMSNDAGDDK